MPHTFQRARSTEAKEERIAALLAAARSLAAPQGLRTVTLTEIAQAAGVHVSGVRRYFGSREEIFLTLAAEEWTAWAQAVATRPSGDGLAATLAGTLAERPLFCDLLAHVPLSLEREVSAEAVRDYKLTALTALEVLLDAITRGSDLSRESAQDLVAAVTSIAGSLWQIAHPPATLARLYAEDERVAHAASDFTPRLTRLTEALVRGL
ncbi:TetR family transcriptional regulator [Paractinoplanes atraurantiacus]|uniref:DNA-binding transcriptional regulator, AcrR family n=1 Tax=Paractinoplanes atraurantiacus TaxID=1036182 RepID=A0A285KTQ2_9ACTN|nr:TetR family transcriptional regulator [Actinoplanes atraurantiacus]SNY76020.1 DNA-binding transcriptional regulator, AcrR family [Actinoplanes atraurantiacus]